MRLSAATSAERYRVSYCGYFQMLRVRRRHGRPEIGGGIVLTDLRARWGIWRIPAWPWVIFPTIFVLGQFSTAEAQDMASFYKKNCAACHSIGGGAMVGPDLAGVQQRRDRAWLVR